MIPPVRVLRGWVRQAYADSITNSTTLEAEIQAKAFKSYNSVSGGTIASVSIRDMATSFSNSDNGSTPESTAEGWELLQDTYDLSNAALIASGIASPTDAQIKTEMLDRLQVVTSLQVDFSDCRRTA